MEGLIPYVYRAIKRRRTRRYYRCLSSGTAQLLPAPKFFSPPPEAARGYRGENHGPHRRHRSMEDFSEEMSPERFPEQRRLGKGSSIQSNRMFACIGGA
ncbi:hypothetical protein Taro_006243 [Colocasia esculenta]|uniref:Uncharacterized protein n=1 Tax=Colocasia esculenta TaxID=4460 RepID=A0A843TQJ6_COLES|nr:hypothetical protein [Colocasia esculenta]